MPNARIVVIAAACAALSACAAPSRPAATQAAARAPAAKPVPVDGVYWGTSTRFRAERRDCPHPGLVKLVVQNGHFQYRWNYRVSVDASIGPDGVVQGQAPDITLVGRRVGRRIDGNVTNGYCGLHFTVNRKP